MTPRRQARHWRRTLAGRGPDFGRVYVAVGPLGAIVGFGSCGAEQTGSMSFGGEVYTLYVDDAWHGRGVGSGLLRVMFAQLTRDDHRSAVIWVLDGNPARWFYEKLGGMLVAQRVSKQWGATITERAYGWSDLGIDRDGPGQ